jgi:poly-gamma-glutamate synthesis protein (capsule biosynthesis protein)
LYGNSTILQIQLNRYHSSYWENAGRKGEKMKYKREIILPLLVATLIIGITAVGAYFGLQPVSFEGSEEIIYPEIEEEETETIAEVLEEEPEEVAEPEEEPVLEPEQQEPDYTEIRIQFAGDVLLHSGFGIVDVARIGDGIYDFRPFLRDIAPFVDGDLAIINMETPVDVFGGNQGIASFPRFNVPFEILEALQYTGFNHLISANNHSFDMGWEGLVNTVTNFGRAGINHTGVHATEEEFHTPTILDVEGVQVGIIAYTDSANGLESLIPHYNLPWAMRRFQSHVMDDVPAMSEEISNLREAGAKLVIVALHWGVEYVDEPSPMQREIARALSDAGADVIMGKHSHSPQPLEWHYRQDGTRALIIYSLGNFLADQTRLSDPTVSSQVNSRFHVTQYGMLVSLDVIKDAEGEIQLVHADIIPTLCMRDFTGSTLFATDAVSVMPVLGGELPEFVEDEDLRLWGRYAYEHLMRIVGEEFMRR